jgi:hypothetical protein
LKLPNGFPTGKTTWLKVALGTDAGMRKKKKEQ